MEVRDVAGGRTQTQTDKKQWPLALGQSTAQRHAQSPVHGLLQQHDSLDN